MKIAAVLPSSPNPRLCSCMTQSLTCVAAPNMGFDTLTVSLKQLCGSGDELCSGVNFNATEGRYGSYRFCNGAQQVSWIYN
jgi:hypothetical protein